MTCWILGVVPPGHLPFIGAGDDWVLAQQLLPGAVVYVVCAWWVLGINDLDLYFNFCC